MKEMNKMNIKQNDFKVLCTTANDDKKIYTNYLINSNGDILTRKNKKLEITIDKDNNHYYVLMINGRAYKKTKEELIKQNF